MSRVFDWYERGHGLEIHAEPGSLVRVTVGIDRGRWPVELPERALVELRRALVEMVGDIDLENAQEALAATEQQLGDAETERDDALDRVRELETELRRVLAEVETLKSAGEIADRRTRGLEQDLERMRHAYDEERAEHRSLAAAALRSGKR